MPQLRVETTTTQTQPLASAAVGGFGQPATYIQAWGSGSGTWSAVFNIAPVSPGGIIGSVRKLTVTNTAPMVDMDVTTGASSFVAWWDTLAGTVTNLIGSVDG